MDEPRSISSDRGKLMTESNSYAKAVWSPALLLSSQSKARALPVKGADKQCHMSILVLLFVADLLHKLAIVEKQLCS